jgi:YVTN family beta-propeller protein
VREGTTPNALALSPDGKRLYVAEADNDAVAVFDVASHERLGRIPAGWYPSHVIATHDRLLVLNSKGRGTAPNPAGHPGTKHEETWALGYVWGSQATAWPQTGTNYGRCASCSVVAHTTSYGSSQP